MFQAISFLRSLPVERVLSDSELRAIYFELREIFEKRESKSPVG